MSKKLVVLVVDDDMINRKLLRSMLMKNSNVDEILESQNGAEALEHLRLRDDINLI